MPYLHLNGLRKAYGTRPAVQHLDLTVEAGEFITLLGPSGCGKTTTLQMVAGFVEPSAGRIVLKGKDLTHTPANQRGLGIVFQSYALFPHMTAAENVAFGLQMRKLPADEVRDRVTQVLAAVGLAERGDQYPKKLSGGQQQRVALARALVIRPELLLLDEPLSNLDANLREEMHLELRQLQRESGTTTLLVTHDQHEAMALSDRIVVMNAGRIEQCGTPVEVYERPATPFVAQFLGKTNLLQAVAQDGHVTMGGQPVTGTTALSGPVTANLRAEKIRLGDPGPGGLSGRITARVFQGNQWLLHLETTVGPTVVLRQNEGTPPPAEGERVGLHWDAADVTFHQTGPQA